MTSTQARAQDDPRTRTDGLGWVTRAVFGDDESVTLRRGAEPGALNWAVVPSLERARFLVPLDNRRVAAASMLAYNALRPPATRAVRAVLGGLASAGTVSVLPFPVLSVRPSDTSLLARLAQLLDEPALAAAIGVRPPDPNRKPVLQLLDGRGQSRGFAKVGWNDATRALVRAEAAALRPVAAEEYPLTPRLLHTVEWADRVVAVTAPLPAAVRQLSDPDRPRTATLLAVARRGGAPGERRPLTTYLRAARVEADRLGGAAVQDRLGGAAVQDPLGGAAAQDPLGGTAAQDRRGGTAAQGLPGGTAAQDLLDTLRRRAGDMMVEFGQWHGDWVPWNLGEVDGRVAAWDWEHCAADVPVGFDLAHQGFTTALILGGRPASQAATAAADAMRRYGAGLGLRYAEGQAITAAYLVEMWLRTARLAAGGAGWNSTLHPSLLEVAKQHIAAL